MWLIALAVAVAGILATLTDWLFMGVLFHASYNRYPEVWRDRGGNERAAIMWSSLIGFVMSAGVSCLCILAGASTFPAALIVASLAFLAGPFVVLIVNGLFIKFDPKVTFAHCLGWFARMALAAVATAIALGPFRALG